MGRSVYQNVVMVDKYDKDGNSHPDYESFNKLQAYLSRKENSSWRKFRTSVIDTPLLIMFTIISKISKVIGRISSLGLPIGIYFAYKTISYLRMNELSLSQYTEYRHWHWVYFFLILPFAAFLIGFIADRLASNLGD